MLSALRIHLQPMFFDTRLTRLATVLGTVHTLFCHAVQRMVFYARSLSDKGGTLRRDVMKRTLEDMISLVVAHVRRANRTDSDTANARVKVPPAVWVRYLALCAVGNVLGSNRTGYEGVLLWAEREAGRVRPGGRAARRLLGEAITKHGSA
jgi:hypothetical protein